MSTSSPQDRPPRKRRVTSATEPEPATGGNAKETPRVTQEETTGAARSPVNPPGKPIKVLQDRLERFLGAMALPFAAAGDMHCANIIATRAPIVAEAWANLAKESPAVKRALEGMMKGGAWGGAIGATVVTVVPIAAHHGAPIPDFVSPMIFGGSSPDNHNNGHNGNAQHAPNAPETSPRPEPGRERDAADPADPRNYPGTHPVE